MSNHSIAGKPVRNGKRKWNVMIIQNDIDKSRNKDPAACAAARAILRENAGLGIKSVRVHIGRTFLEYNDYWERYQTPRSLRTEIVAYDRGGTFMPGMHTVSPLCPSSVKALEDGKPSGRKNRKKKVARTRHYNVFGIRPRGATR